ncbi:MAG: beta-lactamase family protein [Gemmatimonadota bacterium]|nr:beta-lactamase family protein [Gemmatimonadota bacterium]
MYLALLLAATAAMQQPITTYPVTHSSAQADSIADDALIGLWGSESSSGPQIRGEFTLAKAQSGWTAHVGGFILPAGANGDTIIVKLPGGQGSFRGHLAVNNIQGFWIQPAGPFGVDYASPVVLHQEASGSWRGAIVPLDERWSLYLRIARAPDGSLHGSFRNPEANWRGGAAAFTIVRNRDSLRLLDPTTGKQLNAIAYDSAGRRMLMDFGRQIVLTPRSRDDAVGYFARSPANEHYTYGPPAARPADGWTVARGRDVGLDEKTLATLVQQIISADSAPSNTPLVHSILIARHGKLVLEEYFYGFDDTRIHDLRSASKTFTSVMVGAAMLRGVDISPATSVYASFPGGAVLAASDSRRGHMTLGNLLTHTSGLACDDNDEASPGGEDRLQSQTAQSDRYRYMLALPMTHEPGSHYAYCSGGMNLAAGVLAQRTGRWLPALFDEMVAQPLDITHYAINLTPTGEMYGGGGVHMTPRDLLKFGALYLNHGSWRGRRVVSPEWVRESTSKQVSAPTGADGFAWHLYTLTANGRSYREYEANGNGGQFLIVLPELDIAVVFTAGNYGQYGIWRKFRDELMPRYVISATR